ncbi:hypothetical protein GYMLUDRAFT_57594 [Collybiopsis luxurians FD-317 M1]|uniref:Uncharacterized protein n=1 Tax=Collybiopsis luxurians FD-317 M1 TaxID=944289 RepID=A0A0D0CKE1_9AGAR|nr:hypothetical protein GYMLUDRAFT_57594 [Collybiopsis luxurians FD-317 M1]
MKLDNDQAVPNVISVGLQSLTSRSDDNPPREYNDTFSRLRRRSRMPAVDIEDLSPPVSRQAVPLLLMLQPQTHRRNPHLELPIWARSALPTKLPVQKMKMQMGNIRKRSIASESQELALGLHTAADVALGAEDFNNYDLGEGGRDEGAPEEVDNYPEAEIEELQTDFFTF